jgi:hypothetical protein
MAVTFHYHASAGTSPRIVEKLGDLAVLVSKQIRRGEVPGYCSGTLRTEEEFAPATVLSLSQAVEMKKPVYLLTEKGTRSLKIAMDYKGINLSGLDDTQRQRAHFAMAFLREPEAVREIISTDQIERITLS